MHAYCKLPPQALPLPHPHPPTHAHTLRGRPSAAVPPAARRAAIARSMDSRAVI